jgi:hypothetical protein
MGVVVMSSKHEAIKKQVMIDWSAVNRGRLWSNSQYSGKVGNQYVKAGMGKGTSDLIGFEFSSIFGMYEKWPIMCAIEVKTKASPIIKPEQKDFLNYISSVGGMAYIAMETDDGYSLEEWRNDIR